MVVFNHFTLPQNFQLELDWKQGPDMPFETSGYLQSVMLQGKVYVGGSAWKIKNDYTVMEYDTHSGKWEKLPAYTTYQFAMTSIKNQLVLVGGKVDFQSYSNSLGVWNPDSKEWTHPYPDMPTARNAPSAVTYKEWLIVVGGKSGVHTLLSSVDVMNIDSMQWQSVAAPAPTAVAYMWTAVVGDLCYFMGGKDDDQDTNYGYGLSMPALISALDSKTSEEKCRSRIWDKIPGPGLYSSCPCSIRGSLLALGGWDMESGKAVTSIHRYQPLTRDWVKVGNLPSPRSSCTSVKINDGELLVAGGWSEKNPLKTTEIASFVIHYTI